MHKDIESFLYFLSEKHVRKMVEEICKETAEKSFELVFAMDNRGREAHIYQASTDLCQIAFEKIVTQIDEEKKALTLCESENKNPSMICGLIYDLKESIDRFLPLDDWVELFFDKFIQDKFYELFENGVIDENGDKKTALSA